MKRNTLTTAVLAGVAGVAGLTSVSNAVNINTDGLGEVLIYPYYTVNKGLDTLLSVVNTTDTVKAVKVRFMDSKNSAEVLDFNLYLSPFDVWTGVIFDPEGDTEGVAAVLSSDNSCTVPSFTQTGLTTADGIPYVPFSTARFNEFVGVDNSPERTREGHFEMIEMGVVDETVDTQLTGLEAAAIHTAGGVPFNCTALINAWVPGGIWNLAGSRQNETDVDTPAGGLFGAASLISVANGEQVGYNAVAIDAFFEDPAPFRGTVNNFGAGVAGPATLHNEPGTSLPTLNDADSDDVVFPTRNISNIFLNGTVTTSTWEKTGGLSPRLFQRVDALTALFMHNEIYNEYATEVAIGGITEWTVTQPTKSFYVNSSPALLPYTDDFDGDTIADGAACERIGITYTDREEGIPGLTPGSVNFSPFDPASPVFPVLCYEAQVVTYNQDLTTAKVHTQSDFLGSPNARNIDTDTVGGDTYETGWNTIDFVSGLANPIGTPAVGTEDHTLISADAAPGNVYVGLPVTGFSIQVAQNGFLNGGSTLANYAGLFGHRADRRID